MERRTTEERLDALERAVMAQRAVLTWILSELIQRFQPPPLESLRIARGLVMQAASKTAAPPEMPENSEAAATYRAHVAALADSMLQDIEPVMREIQRQRERMKKH